jgi:hypothetical protein
LGFSWPDPGFHREPRRNKSAAAALRPSVSGFPREGFDFNGPPGRFLWIPAASDRRPGRPDRAGVHENRRDFGPDDGAKGAGDPRKFPRHGTGAVFGSCPGHRPPSEPRLSSWETPAASLGDWLDRRGDAADRSGIASCRTPARPDRSPDHEILFPARQMASILAVARGAEESDGDGADAGDAVDHSVRGHAG